MPDPALLSYENLRHASKTWALAAADGESWQDGGIFVASSGIAMRSFNRAYVTSEMSSQSVDRFVTYMAQRDVPFRVSARDGLDTTVLEQACFVENGGIPCLVLDDIAIAAPPTPLEIRPASDETTLGHHVDIVASAFDWSPDELAQVFTPRLLHATGLACFVGYLDGAPVACSQCFVHNGVAGIYYVGTLESQRKRGFGDAMTAHAVRAGAVAGCSMASLQASPMGQPIYQRMGFRRIDYYRTFVPRE
jgi:predicted GNAT family acetyltransferase